MSITTKHIYLDFYNNNLVTVRAKQYDVLARYINVTCTDHGQKVTLRENDMLAFVRYKKSDGNVCFNSGEILEDGTVNIELTPEMLNVSGKQKVDLIITTANGTNVDDLSGIKNPYDANVSVISTMTFEVIVISAPVNDSEITSTSEFGALNDALVRLNATKIALAELNSSLVEQEAIRQDSELIRAERELDRKRDEAARISAEEARVEAEIARAEAEDARVKAEDDRSAAEEARVEAEIARQDAEVIRAQNELKRRSGESLREIAETARSEAETTRLNEWNELKESINDDVSVAINSIDEKIDKAINGLQTIYFNNTVDDSIGENGDVLMVPLISKYDINEDGYVDYTDLDIINNIDYYTNDEKIMARADVNNDGEVNDLDHDAIYDYIKSNE